MKVDNSELQAQLTKQSSELAQAIKQAHQHSEKYLKEKEESEAQFRTMYSQLEQKSKSSEDALNTKIAHLDAETQRLTDTLNGLNQKLAEQAAGEHLSQAQNGFKFIFILAL